VQTIEHGFNEGSFETTYRNIRMLEAAQVLMSPSQYLHLARLKAWTQSRRGQLDGIDLLNRICDTNNLSLSQTADYLFVLRFSGLSPRPEMADYIHSALNRFGGQQTDQFPPTFREHWAAYLLWSGQAREAEPILQGVVNTTPRDKPECLRSLAALANAMRLLGQTDAARTLLEEGRQKQQELRFYGDLADFTLPNLAKLISETDPVAASTVLADAKTMQSRNRNWLGLVRSLLLDARLAVRGELLPHSNEAVLTLAASLPALATCPLFQQIMANWEDWTHDLQATKNGDVFWGL
jgi:hypothetical protein